MTATTTTATRHGTVSTRTTAKGTVRVLATMPGGAVTLDRTLPADAAARQVQLLMASGYVMATDTPAPAKVAPAAGRFAGYSYDRIEDARGMVLLTLWQDGDQRPVLSERYSVAAADAQCKTWAKEGCTCRNTPVAPAKPAAPAPVAKAPAASLPTPIARPAAPVASSDKPAVTPTAPRTTTVRPVTAAQDAVCRLNAALQLVSNATASVRDAMPVTAGMGGDVIRGMADAMGHLDAAYRNVRAAVHVAMAVRDAATTTKQPATAPKAAAAPTPVVNAQSTVVTPIGAHTNGQGDVTHVATASEPQAAAVVKAKCVAVTTKGTPCPNTATKGTTLCAGHTKQAAANARKAAAQTVAPTATAKPVGTVQLTVDASKLAVLAKLAALDVATLEQLWDAARPVAAK